MTNVTKIESLALATAQDWLEGLDYSYVYENPDIAEEDWEDVYDTITSRVSAVLDD